DLVGGDCGDPGQLLAVEQQQAPGDSVGEVDGVVVQQPGDQSPTLVLAGGLSGVVSQGGDQKRAGMAAAGGPAEEVADRVAGVAAGQPLVDVALAGLVQ